MFRLCFETTIGQRDATVTVVYCNTANLDVVEVIYQGVNIMPTLDEDTLHKLHSACFDHWKITIEDPPKKRKEPEPILDSRGRFTGLYHFGPRRWKHA